MSKRLFVHFAESGSASPNRVLAVESYGNTYWVNTPELLEYLKTTGDTINLKNCMSRGVSLETAINDAVNPFIETLTGNVVEVNSEEAIIVLEEVLQQDPLKRLFVFKYTGNNINSTFGLSLTKKKFLVKKPSVNEKDKDIKNLLFKTENRLSEEEIKDKPFVFERVAKIPQNGHNVLVAPNAVYYRTSPFTDLSLTKFYMFGRKYECIEELHMVLLYACYLGFSKENYTKAYNDITSRSNIIYPRLLKLVLHEIISNKRTFDYYTEEQLKELQTQAQELAYEGDVYPESYSNLHLFLSEESQQKYHELLRDVYVFALANKFDNLHVVFNALLVRHQNKIWLHVRKRYENSAWHVPKVYCDINKLPPSSDDAKKEFKNNEKLDRKDLTEEQIADYLKNNLGAIHFNAALKIFNNQEQMEEFTKEFQDNYKDLLC